MLELLLSFGVYANIVTVRVIIIIFFLGVNLKVTYKEIQSEILRVSVHVILIYLYIFESFTFVYKHAVF